MLTTVLLYSHCVSVFSSRKSMPSDPSAHSRRLGSSRSSWSCRSTGEKPECVIRRVTSTQRLMMTHFLLSCHYRDVTGSLCSGEKRRLSEDIAFRMLAAYNQPDSRTSSDFRRRHLFALEGLRPGAAHADAGAVGCDTACDVTPQDDPVLPLSIEVHGRSTDRP